MDDGRIHLGDGHEDARRRTPWTGFLLAYAAMAPIVGGAVAFFLLPGSYADRAMHATIIWSGAVVCFLAGVRRGLSFRQEGGPLLTQLATMLWLFVLGAASLLAPWAFVSLSLQIIGFATMAIYDPIAAREGETPRYFQRLRPVQMLLPIFSLALILARLLA